MPKFSVERFRGASHVWDEFVTASNEGTIFHQKLFLGYHTRRFEANEHDLMFTRPDRNHRIVAVMPMAIFEEGNRRRTRSPYGASYGGPVFTHSFNYHDAMELLTALVNYLESMQVESLAITLPIMPVYTVFSETFRLAMHECGFKVVNRDISSSVCLLDSLPAHKPMAIRAPKQRRLLRKAEKHGLEVRINAPLDDFWSVLEKTFAKHGASPTHTRDELAWLNEAFPEAIYFACAYHKGEPVSGLGLFALNAKVMNAFYIVNDPTHQHLQGLSMLVSKLMEQTAGQGFGWFDMGTSSDGFQGRDNIFRFKESFGAIGFFRETYKLVLA